MGHYVLSAAAFGKGPPRAVRGPSLAASRFEWSFLGKRPGVSDGGVHLPIAEGRLLRFGPPNVFSASKTATLGDARDVSVSDPKKISMKLRVNRGHMSANQLKRALVDSESGSSHLANFADDVLVHCDI